MEIVLYAAMTGAEFQNCRTFPAHLAWMACHFSACSPGISNEPPPLPEGSLLILNDESPLADHDPALISAQLKNIAAKHRCSGILLDFQRSGADDIVADVTALSVPVAVTPSYAKNRNCAVFLPPPPMTIPLYRYLAPWKGQKIWLELAPEHHCIRLTGEGSFSVDAPPFPCPHVDEALHCRYGMDIVEDHVDFHFQRDFPQLEALMHEGAELGVYQYVGLYQQLGSFSSQPDAHATARFQL